MLEVLIMLSKLKKLNVNATLWVVFSFLLLYILSFLFGVCVGLITGVFVILFALA